MPDYDNDYCVFVFFDFIYFLFCWSIRNRQWCLILGGLGMEWFMLLLSWVCCSCCFSAAAAAACIEWRNGNILVFGGRKKEVDNTSVLVASCHPLKSLLEQNDTRVFHAIPCLVVIDFPYKYIYIHVHMFNCLYAFEFVWVSQIKLIYCLTQFSFVLLSNSSENCYILHVCNWKQKKKLFYIFVYERENCTNVRQSGLHEYCYREKAFSSCLETCLYV